MQRKVQLEDKKRLQHFGDPRMDGSLLLLHNLLPLTQSIVLTLTSIHKFMNESMENSVQCKVIGTRYFRLPP